jgi:ABC-type dipeptide/oligopeptide/nickel transport system permease component
VLTETVFAWPGVGSWMLDAIRFRDYAVLQGGILFFAVLIVIVNLLVDVSYAFLNPRIRYQ